jgi:hypothetical protein
MMTEVDGRIRRRPHCVFYVDNKNRQEQGKKEKQKNKRAKETTE